MEKVMWLVLGVTVIVVSLRADRSRRARLVVRVALGVLFLVFGAMVNAVYLISDWDSVAAFGELSQFTFVRDTWASLVVPNTGLFIGLLFFGRWLWLYAVPMLGALTLLLRAERRPTHTGTSETDDDGPVTHRAGGVLMPGWRR